MALHDVSAAFDSGREVAYAEITSNATATATTEGTAEVVVTAGAFIADGTSAYLVTFYTDVLQAPDDGSAELALYQDGSSIGKIGYVQATDSSADTVQHLNSMFVARRLTPSAGSRTYSIRLFGSAGTKTVHAGAGGSGNAMPAFIRITKA